MYHLLAHLADPSGWAAVPELATDARTADAFLTLGDTRPASMLPIEEHGSVFRAPVPRLRVSR